MPQRYIDDAMSFVHRCWVEQDGLFHYTAQGSQSFHYTRGSDGFGDSFAGAGGAASKPAGAGGGGLAAGASISILWGDDSRTGGDRFFYSTYYCSQAAAQLGGRYWKGIFPPIAEVMVRNQQPDGSLIARGRWNWSGGRGGGGGDGEWQFGPVYTTALAVLSLTPAYQLLPVYQR